jgi:hypothetical protein
MVHSFLKLSLPPDTPLPTVFAARLPVRAHRSSGATFRGGDFIQQVLGFRDQGAIETLATGRAPIVKGSVCGMAQAKSGFQESDEKMTPEAVPALGGSAAGKRQKAGCRSRSVTGGMPVSSGSPCKKHESGNREDLTEQAITMASSRSPEAFRFSPSRSQGA